MDVSSIIYIYTYGQSYKNGIDIIYVIHPYLTEDLGLGNCFLFAWRFLISVTGQHQSTRSRASTAHIKPIGMAKPLELCCEEPGDAIKLGWTEHSEPRQAGPGTNLPEPFNLVQAIRKEISIYRHVQVN